MSWWPVYTKSYLIDGSKGGRRVVSLIVDQSVNRLGITICLQFEI